MIILWMAYGTLVGALLGGAALAAERGASLARRPVRWVWLAAIAATIALSARVWRTLEPRAPIALRAGAVVSRDRAGEASPSAVSLFTARVNEMLHRGLDVARWIAPAMPHASGRAVDVIVTLVWILASLLLVGLWLAVQRRMARARARWPRTELHGVEVRLSENAGPAVVGIRRPEVVVPRWLLAREAVEQRLVVAHEAEHVRAHDPWMLAAAWLAVAIAPWNLPLWFMLSRLRLAIELDCDARVLRAGAAPRSYGSLLIDVAQHASFSRPAALALAGRPSHLHHRIVAMQNRTPRFARARIGMIAGASAAALLAACEARMPTSADVDTMSVASAERAARQLTILDRVDSNIVYKVDGSTVSSDEAHAVQAGRIARMNILKDSAGHATVAITTKTRDARAASEAHIVFDTAVVRGRLERRVAGNGDVVPVPKTPIVVYLDGKKVDQSVLATLDRNSIAGVEVLKGVAAQAVYHQPDGTGVIVITTKHGSK